tara:strand:- start:806 stop:1222 length:417 start_codon:yes stop_codon:yes gene_type:complete
MNRITNYFFPNKTKEKTFKKTIPLSQRIALQHKLFDSNPDRIPVILETFDRTLHVTKNKYLVPVEMTFNQFVNTTRFLHIKDSDEVPITASDAIFFYLHGAVMPPGSMLMAQVYEKYSDPEDHLLYLVVCRENTFGSI